MQTKYQFFGFILFCSLFFSCTAYDVGSATKDEKLHMKIKEERNMINADNLKSQRVLTLGDRAEEDAAGARGLLSSLGGGLVSMATDAVKQMIAKEQKKYVADYNFGLTDLYFYDQLALDSPFDPVGLQFNGFKLIRTFINKDEKVDTALFADFALDTSRSSEMINNSIFRLKVKDFQLHYAKAKLTKSTKKKLNLDIEISFLTSYVNSQGSLFDNVLLGKFYFILRDAPLDPGEAGYKEYYAKLKDTMLLGKSFIVPRSFGYYRGTDHQIHSGYSQGAYSIQVKVTESSKNNFVDKLIIENAPLIIDATGNQIKSKIKSL